MTNTQFVKDNKDLPTVMMDFYDRGKDVSLDGLDPKKVEWENAVQRNNFRYMLFRDGYPNAGFLDLEPLPIDKSLSFSTPEDTTKAANGYEDDRISEQVN